MTVTNRIRFYDGRECEIGVTHYKPKKSSRRLRYVVMRAEKPQPKESLFEDHIEYDYLVFCTSLDEVRHPRREVIFYYRKRGQAENHIKEAKYGDDLKHYPCQSLLANKAYGLIAAFSYNIMRYIALCEAPKTGTKTIKTLRNKLIFIPCMVAQTCREKITRMNRFHMEVLTKWLEIIKIPKLVCIPSNSG